MAGIEWLVSPGAAATMMSTSKPIIEFCCTESIARFRLEEPSWESSVRLLSSRSHACHLRFHLAQQLCREDRGTGQAKGSQGQVPRLGCVIDFFLQIFVFAIMVDDVILFGGRMMWCWPISSWSRPPTCLSQTWTYFLWSGEARSAAKHLYNNILNIMLWHLDNHIWI